jgi:hypothetical protein
MLTTIAVLFILGIVASGLTVAVVFANKFAVLCLTLLTGYLGTLVYLAVKGRKEQPASRLVVLDQDYLRTRAEDRQMALRRVS